MSDITINVCQSDDRAQSGPPIGGQWKKKKRLRKKKLRHLEQRGHLEANCAHNHRMGQFRHEHTRHNGASAKLLQPSLPTSTHSKALPCPSSKASASHCSSEPSAHSLPSSSASANHKGRNQNPNEPVNRKLKATPCWPSASSSQRPTGIPTKYLAIDCEMVGTGPKGSISQLARCSLVSYEGDVVYDKFINPSMPVTDYRTRWSGIRRCDLVNAMPYSEARKEILRLLMGKVVIGHAIHNDFKVLGYSHPSVLTRDTSRIPLLNLKAGFAANECASLKRLTKAIFNRNIQTGRKGHSSVEDARATMELYKVVEEEWERNLASKSQAS